MTGAFYSVVVTEMVTARTENPSTHHGSGIAAKQYDPGAPFFGAMSYEL
jgi:hypothetical protein